MALVRLACIGRLTLQPKGDATVNHDHRKVILREQCAVLPTKMPNAKHCAMCCSVEDTAMTKPSDAADGTAVIAAIVVMPCDMGSPSCRAEESPVHSAADEDAEREALSCWWVEDTTATTPSDAAEGTAVIAAIVVGEMPCDMGSPSCRAEESPVHSAADEDAEREDTQQ